MENKNYLSTINILKGVIIGGLFGKINQKISRDFPPTIGDYKFFKYFGSGQEQSRMYSLALYKDGKRKKALAKMWTGVVKDLPYYTLLNEILIFQTLNKVLQREKTEINKIYKNITIPNLEGKHISDKKVIMLTQYIENCQTADTSTSKLAFKTMITAYDYLRYIGSKMTDTEKTNLTKRSIRTIALYYPLLLAKALIAHPELTKYLLKGIPYVLRGLPKLLKKNNLNLGHRDLHLKNVLISKTRKIYLVDLQFCVISYDMYDILFSIRHGFENKYFRDKLLKEINKRYGVSVTTDWVRALTIISATHGVSGGDLPKQIIKNSIDFLKFSLKK